MAQNLITKHIIEAVVKPTLDKGEREKLNADLGRIFADASNIDFNTKETRDSLNNLARAFQAIFDKIGDKSIDFEELIKMPAPDTFAKLGEVAAKQFWNAWESVAKGMSGGASQDMLKEQFNQLKKQRAELVKRQKALPLKQDKLDSLSDILYAEQDEFHAFSKDELKKFGKSVDDVALDMTDALSRTMDELGNLKGGTQEFEIALERAYEQLNDVFRMSRTLAKQPDLVSDKTILADYDFDLLQEDYVESLMNYEKAFTNIMFSIKDEINSIPAKLKEIDDKILQIQHSGIELVNQTSAKNGLKTLNEIEEAYKRILNHKAVGGEFRANQKEVDKIQSTLDFDPTQSKQGIKSLYEDYQKAAASGNWEAEYQALLKYIRLYEEYQKSENKTHRNKITRPDNPFTPLYERLKPMAENAQNALQNIVNMAKDQPLVGMGGAGGDGSGDASDEAANAERIAESKRVAAEKEAEAKKEADARAEAERKAAEESERQMKAEKEKAAALKQQRIEEEKLTKAAEKRVDLEKKEKALILEKKEAIAEMFRMSNEGGLFFNSETGEVSDPLEGEKHRVVTTLDEWKQAAATQFDTRLHKHNYNVAAPSFSSEHNDFVTWLKGFEHIKKQMVLANEEILSFDFSSISKETLRSIATLYTQAAKEIDAEFDGYIANRKVGEMFGTFDNMQEQMQVRLREVLESIMAKHPGVMTSYQLPSDMINTSKAKPVGVQDDSVDKRGVEILKVEADAHRDNVDAINEEARAVENLNNAKAEESGLSLVDKYSQASDEIKKTYQEIIALQDQIDELESKTQKTPIDMDPWNATKEQKDQIVAAWREYQKVIQEIANMPIVETEDDERRLLELKAKAVSLYETMRQGHLNDVLGDGYAKEYGLSIEDGKQMHLDMQDEPRKDFDKSLGGLKSKLNDTYNAAQKLDQEMYVMMLRADDDSIKSLYDRIRQDALSAKPAVEAVNDVVEETKMLTQQNDSELDDDAEILEKENGALEDKLELLRDIAEQYGHNITQKQRDRFEELNQKDMNEGLTAREDERYWELGEQIEEADNALEDFEQTYDRIIVKLANGKSVEILPDDKGLRTLAKIDEEYGESYNGVEIEDVIYERIRKEAAVAEQAVDALNDSIEETKNVAQSSGSGTGTGDASSAELEAAVTKTEALQDEVEQKNKELADKDAEIARVRAENEAKLKTEADEKDRLQEDLNAKNQQLADVQHENELYDTALAKAEEESNVKDGVIRDLREQLANVKTGTGEEQASVSSEELKNVLSSIVYNVKITHDDNDKTANKIAIDESVLESTLKRVFTNVLDPHTEQNDSEPKNEPWALEKTLQTVKGVLDNIQTNTAKSESVEVAPAKVEVGNVLATENTLAAIKTAVESINTKVVKGTKAKTSENSGGKNAGVGKKNAGSYAGSQYFPEKLKTQTMQLAKFRAQLMTTGKLTDDVDSQIYELLDALAQVKSGPDFSQWVQKFQQLKTSVGITDIFDKAEGKEVTASYQQLIEFQKTRNKLELQYEKAQDGSALKQFYAEQLTQMNSVIAKQEEILENEEYEAKLAKIREEQARKLGEVEAKAADKAAKKTAADQKKLAKRQAMTGKAGSAIGRAEGVWLEAEGLEQAKLPQGFKKQVNEYYDALEKLRLKHHEINTSDVVTEQQQNELIKQTAEVNRLTSEIGELVAEYQKLSGSNVDEADSRATTLTGQSGLIEYEATLKQYVREITKGKGQIKSFNAETKTLTYTVKTGKNEFTEYTAVVRNLDHQLVSVQGTTKRTETFFEATARKMKELTSYFSGMAVFNQIGQELRRGIQYVREIDDALVELRKVTDETDESYDKFLRTAAKTGSVIGATISEVTEATATFSKLGYDMEMATEMAESAIVYKNVGDNIASAEDAADSIISTLKGFRLESSETMRIVDRFNEVGKSIAHVI